MKQSLRSRLKGYIAKQLWQLEYSRKVFEGNAAILMLHRIAPIDSNKLPINEALKVSPEFLETFIKEAKQQGYTFVSLDELTCNLKDSRSFNKLLCITIDDGYKDNLTYGYPIFDSYRVPFCIYICTSFPESTHNMWWFALEDYILENDIYIYSTQSISQKESLFLDLRTKIIQNSSSYTDSMAICQELGIVYDPRIYDHLTLSWEDISFLATNPLVTIGNHTHTHPVFNRLTMQDVSNDILKAQKLFNKYNLEPKHFAYPFGSKVEVDSKYFTIPKELGFISATTTRMGSIYPKHREFLYALPRFMLTDTFSFKDIYKPRRKRIVTS
ncbi:polysaccharide deacetylase family protein [Helicobacter equorum]|uniref:polysaccharide deacetylase family protein n=1 Tax=Helicobacter equorum TaxID=361872 RepID=UPI000CF1A5E3|nr:polysaccharide deacetylase family protein [Helicobacter equorum]